MRRLFLLAIVVVAIVVGRHLFNVPVDAGNTDPVTVDIPSGTGVREAGRILKKAGVLRSPLGFSVLAILRGDRSKIQAGTYSVNAAESGTTILSRLTGGETVPQGENITIPEGFTLQQIADRLDARGVTGKQAFLEAARADAFRSEFSFLTSAPAGASLEGYLFPDTYRLRVATEPADIIRRMLSQFATQWESAQRAACSVQSGSSPAACRLPPASVHEIVTMASIIEREVQTPEDRRLVSGVLWKRFDAGIGLDVDATVRYALTKWDGRLTVDDLAINSSYNTRRYRGLPPGPIGNPGLDTLKAALAPQESEYLYYLSASAGKRTIFSRTLDEHNQAKAEHIQ